MRLVIAACSVSYEGRGKTTLDLGTRLVMLKKDGSVSVHSDDRAYKPLNWMLSPCDFVEDIDSNGHIRWTFTSKKDQLEIVFQEVFLDEEHDWGVVEPGLIREWTEPDLQAWIADNVPAVFGRGWRFLAREYATGAGPVDLLVQDPRGKHVAVEVKRTAHMPAVDQVLRYVAALDDKEDPEVRGPVRGIVVALEIKPTTAALAEKRGVTCIAIPPPA